MSARIDLVDPGPDAAALAAALRDAGHEVALRALPDVVGTGADVLLLAGDAAGALEALRALRDDGASPDTPVVLLGTPAGTGHRGAGEPGFGAEAVLLRPIDPDALVDVVARLLSPPSGERSRTMPRRERTMQLESPEHTGMRASTPRGAHPERTQQLPDTGTDPLRGVEQLPSPRRAPAERADEQERAPATGSSVRTPAPSETPSPRPSDAGTPAPLSSSSAGALRARATISDRLRTLLEAADRRAFPGRPPIDLSLPGGDEPAAELVPAELLEHDELALDAIAHDDDPIDQFTYVGGALPGAPPLPDPSPTAAPHAGEEPPPSAAAQQGDRKTSPGTPTSLSRRPPPPGARAPSALPPGAPAAGPPPSARPPTQIEAPREDERWDAAGPPIGATARGGGDVDTGVHEARVRPASVAPPPPTATGDEWPEEDSVLGRASPEGGRRGALGAGGALRLLLRIGELRLDARLTITPPSGESISLVLAAGELVALEANAALRALDHLRRLGRALGTAVDEAGARRALDEAVEARAISRFERDRALREGRLRVLVELLREPRASFALARLLPSELPSRGASPLGAPLRLAVVEAARRAIDAAHARTILGGGGEGGATAGRAITQTGVGGLTIALRRAARFDAIGAEGLMPPEIAALLARLEGEPIERVWQEAPDEPGLPGLLAALVAAGALHAELAPARQDAARTSEEGARAARRAIDDAARLAEESDYFALLGVAPDASDRDVAEAHRARAAQLDAIALEDLGLASLEPARRAAREALDEARAVLADRRLREAYAAALHPSAPSVPVAR